MKVKLIIAGIVLLLGIIALNAIRNRPESVIEENQEEAIEEAAPELDQ